jgi:anthranilate/para-aminobenzoate synthase component I
LSIAALANFENFSIISSSPERLFSVDGVILMGLPTQDLKEPTVLLFL